MASTITAVAIAALLAASALFAVAMALGLERVWEYVGPPDLGPVTFETLQRRAAPNDALACPSDLCGAASDIPPPLYAVGTDMLRQAMSRVIASEPDVTQVESAALTERYIQRSRMMRFPDTVVIRYIPQGPGQSTLAIYSRSQLGKGDLGVNKARIRRWLDKLSREAPVSGELPLSREVPAAR